MPPLIEQYDKSKQPAAVLQNNAAIAGEPDAKFGVSGATELQEIPA